MPRLTEQAVCIRHLDWSQSSQIVVLFTAHHGKLRGLAKGSKRWSPSSLARFSGGIELLTRGQAVAVVRPSRELATITEWDLLDDHLHLRRDLHKQRLALYAADVLAATTADHDPHPALYAALCTLLETLRQAGPDDADRALGAFQWTLLIETGFAPRLDRDAVTGEALPAVQTYRFDPRAGGLTADGAVDEWRVRRSTVELLRAGDWSGAAPAVVRRANRLMCSYVRFVIDRELPTMRYVLRRPD